MERAITREEVDAFAAHVLGELRLDWKMKWTRAQPGICLKKSQEILIPESMIGQYRWQPKSLLLLIALRGIPMMKEILIYIKVDAIVGLAAGNEHQTMRKGLSDG